MKKKILSVMLTVTLVLSIGLMYAVPAVAVTPTPPGTVTLTDPVEATITRTDTLDTITFAIDIISENVPHGVYGIGLVFATSLGGPAFQVWYAEAGVAQGAPGVGWWYQAYEWGTNPNITLEASGTGITATGDGASGEKAFAVTIPTEVLGGFGATYDYAVQVRTNLIGTYPEGVNVFGSDVSGFASVGLKVLNENTGNLHGTIQAAVDAADPDNTVIVAAGMYPENVAINKTLTLLSTSGSEDTTIQGDIALGSEMGTVSVTSNTDGLQIGDIGRGFTIIGIDGTPGLEKAAVYFQGDHSNAVIKGNDIVANGDAGLLTEWGATITGFVISDNEFSGQTFLGDTPGGEGFGAQFTEPNVPRQLANMGGGSGGGNTADITFTGNHITGTAGGTNIKSNPQGNTLLTIDSVGSTITSNIFEGTTTRYGTSLRARGPDAVITENDFKSTGLTPSNGHLYLVNNPINSALIATNTFDKGVYVENASGGTIGLSIQGFASAVPENTTINVLAGTYAENVTIGTADVTLQAVTKHESVIKGTVMITADSVIVDSFSITDFSQIPTPDWAGIYVPSGTGVVISNNLIDGSNLDPVANLTVGIHTLYGGSAEITAQGNTIVNCRMGIYNQGAAMLIEENVIEDNGWCGIGVDTALGTEIYENSIRNNVVGIEVFQTGVVAHFNNICGNTEYGLWVKPGVYVDATENYWCDPSGPSHSPGYGDKVSGDVLYDPWLLEPVVPGVPLPTTFDKTLSLNIGWTLVSTDSWIDTEKTVGTGVVLAYGYTPIGAWVEVTPAALVPVDALYLKTVDGGAVGIIYSGGYPAASSKNLKVGWNLISSATEGNARDILSPLRYIDVGDEQGVGLATLVSQGDFNQHTGSFYQSTVDSSDWNDLFDLNPFDGYWAYMNAAKEFGVVVVK